MVRRGQQNSLAICYRSKPCFAIQSFDVGFAKQKLLILYAREFKELLIDKQELIRNTVLKTNGLCGSDTMDVSVRRQFEGKIFGFRKISEPINGKTIVGSVMR